MRSIAASARATIGKRRTERTTFHSRRLDQAASTTWGEAVAAMTRQTSIWDMKHKGVSAMQALTSTRAARNAAPDVADLGGSPRVAGSRELGSGGSVRKLPSTGYDRIQPT